MATKTAKKTTPTRNLENVLPYLLAVGGAVGLAASFILSLEKIALLKNPAYVPSCNLSPILSCGSVIRTPQASAFGFPNPFIGLVGFGVVICVGMALLAGAKYKRWFWRGLELGTLLGVMFVHWLAFESIYRIGALCVYCMVVWVTTVTLFWYTTLHNIRNNNLPVPKQLTKVVPFIQRHHVDLLVLWILGFATAILTHFWYYWQTLI